MKSVKKHLKWIVAGALSVTVAGIALSPVVQAKPDASDSNRIVMVGSTTVGPIAKAFADRYKDLYPKVTIEISESGSGDGAKALVEGTCDIANMSRNMKDKEFKKASGLGIQPVAHVVAMDGLAVCVHPSNPVGKITMEQIKDIYLGKITNWKDLGGPDKAIIPIGRAENSGTYETFHKLVMKKEKEVGTKETAESNAKVLNRLRSTPEAISYLGLGFADQGGVKILPVNGIEATAETIKTGEYPIARPLFMYTNGYPKLGSNVFLMVTFYLRPEGQQLVEEVGFIPMTSYK